MLEARTKSNGTDLDTVLCFVDSHFRAEITQISVLAAYEEFINGRTPVALAG